MGYANDTGYIALTFQEIMDIFMAGYNTQFSTSYTPETFVGTNAYKYFYTVAQRVQEGEIKTSEIFLKVQDYFEFTNEKILNPKVTTEGLISAFDAEGYEISVKPMIEADAGKINICVNVDDSDPDYAETKLEICNLIKDYTCAGVVSMGTESETIVLTNGQSFDFKYHLPDITEIFLRLTITTSRNNQTVILSPEAVKEILMANIAERYSLGKDFEPERYFTVADAPWASDILLEYSEDEMTWEDETFEAEFDELFVILLENITVVEA